METKTFKIINLPGLSGLHVVAEYQDDLDLYRVHELINVGVVIGDRLLRYPMPDGAIWLSPEFLEETEDISAREFSAENPYGKYKYDGRFEKDDLVIVHAVYENAITVTIFEKHGESQKTIYAGNFFEKKQMALEFIEQLLHGKMDPDDVIFELKTLEGK